MTNNPHSPWKVQLGKLNNDEWAADVTFAGLSDEQWAVVRSLAEKYAKFNSRVCPPVSVSDGNHRLRFRLGHAMEKLQAVDKLSSVECEMLRNNLVGVCEGLHKHGLGLRYLDRELVWKVDGSFAFVPVFWLPALPEVVAKLPGIAPECTPETMAEPSTKADIYAIASFCYQSLTGREHDANDVVLPGDIDPTLRTWDTILDPRIFAFLPP